MTNKRKILYISTLCSNNSWDYVFRTSIKKPGQSAQKFHRLVANGFSKNHTECEIETLSMIPVVSNSHFRKIWTLKSDKEDRIRYNYIPFVNYPFFKELTVSIYTFFYVILWSWKNKKCNPVVICDILNMTITITSLLACKITKTKTTALITDLPNLMISSQTSQSLKIKVYSFISTKFLKYFNNYILLTKYMNQVVNPLNRPHIIMEGLVDINNNNIRNNLEDKAKELILIYAGGIYEEYGVKDLIHSFMLLDDQNIRLHIYGPGPMAEEMFNYCHKDNRIKYFGIVPNHEVVKALVSATLLVNPRPSTLELSKFSFPSKNMEYMASGTPLLTSALPGMPVEYYEYVYLIQEENITGMHDIIKNLLSQSREVLHEMGSNAKKFVLEKKNNVSQAKRLLDFFNEHNKAN